MPRKRSSTARPTGGGPAAPAYQRAPATGAMIVSEDIVPFGEFKATASAIFRRLRANRRPIVVTHHGRPAGVVITPEEWDQIQYERRFRAAVLESLAQADRGELIDDKDVGREIETWFREPAGQ